MKSIIGSGMGNSFSTQLAERNPARLETPAHGIVWHAVGKEKGALGARGLGTLSPTGSGEKGRGVAAGLRRDHLYQVALFSPRP